MRITSSFGVEIRKPNSCIHQTMKIYRAAVGYLIRADSLASRGGSVRIQDAKTGFRFAVSKTLTHFHSPPYHRLRLFYVQIHQNTPHFLSSSLLTFYTET